jgi:hypothetical protein
MAQGNNSAALIQAINDNLRGVREDHPIWLAVMLLLDHQKEVAEQQALVEQLEPGVRDYRAGMEAGLKTFKATLLIMHRSANSGRAATAGD